MKRILLFVVVVGLFAGQASAAMYYEMDAVTAGGMTLQGVTSPSVDFGGSIGVISDTASVTYIGYSLVL